MIRAILVDIAKEWGFQKEKGNGENEYEHYQGVFSLKTQKQAMGTVKNLLGFNDVHLETCRDWPKAKEYCTKADTRIDGPWSTWSPKLDPEYQITKGQFYDWQNTVYDWLMEKPDNRFINWIVDKKGANGKSMFVNYCIDNLGAAAFNNGKESDIAYAYKEERIVCFDLPRAKAHVNYVTMEDMKNGRLFSGKYESCNKRFNPPHIVVMANWMPDFEKMSLDRWKLWTLEDKVLTRTYNATYKNALGEEKSVQLS